MAKSNRVLIRLNSTGKQEDGKSTGYFETAYVSTQLKVKQGGKLKLKRFDPRAWNPKTGKCGMHVEFVEGKVK